jgi:hypothetical protein
MATTSSSAVSLPGRTSALARPIALTGGNKWLIGSLFVAALFYYLIGVDEGAYSLFGNSMVVHEFVHDARHFLGFPCH